MSEVRVRFAPSPTGPLHIGGVRTALYNYLFAKKYHGKFIIRIEDTDQQRLVKGAEEYIHQSLRWLGINADESVEVGGNYAPYKQSERKEIYNKYIKEILNTDYAYIAFDTNEELDTLRKEYEAKGEVFSYGITTRMSLKNSLSLPQDEVEKKIASGVPYVVRFKMPEKRIVEVEDIIRGTFTVDTQTLDDKVLYKTDGLPTYHFANIVDDYCMKISHVIRGEEWLPSLPLHLLLYEAMNWKAPKFAHLPLILKPVGNGKLSKRDGDKYGFPVFPLNFTDNEGKTSLGYKEFGYLPEAVINLLALIGWSNKDNQEIYSIDELIKKFDLEEVSKSGARFNPEKAVWFNHEYIQMKSEESLVENLAILLQENNIISSVEKNKAVISLVKERLDYVNEILKDNEKGKFFYLKPEKFTEKDLQKVLKEDTNYLLETFLISIENIDWNEEALAKHLKQFSEEQQIGMGKIMMPIRLSLVGEMKGPDIPKIMNILGKEETKNRILFLLKH